MKPVLRMLAIALLLAVAGVRAPAGVGAPVEPLTLDAVYRNMEAALSRDGAVSHVTIVNEGALGEHSYGATTDVWLDAKVRVARSDIATTYAAAPYATQRYTRVTGDDVAYIIEDGKNPLRHKPLVCRRAPSAAISALLGCRGGIERERSVLLSTDLTYAGVEAVSIVSETEVHGRDGIVRFRDTLYIDAATFLPIGLISEGAGDDASRSTARSTARYAHEFVPDSYFTYVLTTLPDTALPDAEATLRFSTGVYWLGREFTPSGGSSRLALQSVFLPEWLASPYVGARAHVTYRASDDFGPDAVTLQIWDAAAWRANSGGRDLPAIAFGETIIAIDAHTSELTSAEAVAAIIAALRPYGG